MAIAVICPNCNASFRVSDKFAGKTGPCPKCKTPIQIPDLKDEIVVHHPEPSSGKDSKGRDIAKPLLHIQTKISRNAVLIGLGSTLVIFLAARLLGAKLQSPDNVVLRTLGLALVTPLLAIVGYFFLRDREKLHIFRGRRLWLRTAICTVIYIALWAPYGYLRDQYDFPTEIFQLYFIVPPMLALGSLAALGCYDFDFGAAFLHYSFHLLVVLALCYVAGMHYLWIGIA